MEKKFSSILSGLRKTSGLSQRQAAIDLHISQALLSHYENGAREPGLSFVCRACDYYSVSADRMLGRDEFNVSGISKEAGSALSELNQKLVELKNEDMSRAASDCIRAQAEKLQHLISDSGFEGTLRANAQRAAAEENLHEAYKNLDH